MSLDLTDVEIADLEANYPHQDGLSDDQYDAWLNQAYFLRHWMDDELLNWW